LKGQEEPFMVADLTTPRFQLPFEQLPRGLVPFPQRVLEGVEQHQEKLGRRFTPEQLRRQLEIETLAYFYLDYPVAYRPVPEGLEVLGVGDAEVAPFWRNPEDGVQVVQP
jgi:hypothetical protein